jgi:hypothetical protein
MPSHSKEQGVIVTTPGILRLESSARAKAQPAKIPASGMDSNQAYRAHTQRLVSYSGGGPLGYPHVVEHVQPTTRVTKSQMPRAGGRSQQAVKGLEGIHKDKSRAARKAEAKKHKKKPHVQKGKKQDNSRSKPPDKANNEESQTKPWPGADVPMLVDLAIIGGGLAVGFIGWELGFTPLTVTGLAAMGVGIYLVVAKIKSYSLVGLAGAAKDDAYNWFDNLIGLQRTQAKPGECNFTRGWLFKWLPVTDPFTVASYAKCQGTKLANKIRN